MTDGHQMNCTASSLWQKKDKRQRWIVDYKKNCPKDKEMADK